MKKLISLLLAVSVMAASSVAFAADLGAAGQRNEDFAIMPEAENYVPGQIATYRPGDTIIFKNGTGVTFTAGNVVTFISSKVGAGISDTTVMFIDQVTVTANEQTNGFTYKIREGLAEGIYKIDIRNDNDNNGEAEVTSFYYAVGDPKVEIARVDEEDGDQYYYVEASDTYYYFALATTGSDEVTFTQAGVDEVGFKFTDSKGNNKTATFSAASIDAAMADQPGDGSIEWWFSVGVVNDDNAIAAPAVEGVIINK